MATAQYLAAVKSSGKDAVTVQSETPRVIAELIKGVPREELRRRPAPGKWSVAEIIAHLAEDEIVQIWRYRQMLEAPGVALAGFDPMTVRSLMEHMAGHDLNHLEQIKRILKK